MVVTMMMMLMVMDEKRHNLAKKNRKKKRYIYTLIPIQYPDIYNVQEKGNKLEIILNYRHYGSQNHISFTIQVN